MKKRIGILCLLTVLLLGGCGRGNDEPTNLDEGYTALEEERFDDAIASFDTAIAEVEDEVSAYRGRGIAYLGLGNYSEALSNFNQALESTTDRMEDTRKDILYYKASAQYQQEDFDGTIESCSEILQIADEADAHYLRGASFMEKGEEDTAKADFDAAVALAPSDYSLYLNIYECYREQNLSADGDDYLNTALSIESTDEADNYDKARIYYYLEDYEQAQELLGPLVESLDGPSLLLMGQVYLKLNDTAHARSVYQQYKSSVGEIPAVYNGLVLCDLADGDTQSAIDNALTGLELNEDDGKQELLYNLIVVYEEAGDYESAKQRSQEYISLYPSDEAGVREYEFLMSR